jgi:catechol 2,3-dioxygenase-like lactoylglutathione lyase family enzyme
MNRIVVYLRGLTIFVAGIVIGTLLIQPSAADGNRLTGVRLNHFGIAVKDLDESTNFYTKVMGFKVAFQFSPDGKHKTTYFQISRDTFVEMSQANDRTPPGITHVGMETPDVKKTLEELKANGGNPQALNDKSPTKALLGSIIDPNGIRLEFVELTPDSMHRKAVESWK